MSQTKVFHCIVDETPLTTNLTDIEQWVHKGVVTLVIPLHTLERLHVLKKDASAIGQNARKAMKFLDDITSAPGLRDPVTIQGPDDQYATWSLVEKHYNQSTDTDQAPGPSVPADNAQPEDGAPTPLIEKLNLESHDRISSPVSTPPMSPSSSEPQSTKPSPEVVCASINKHDVSPVPPALKGLLNPVVWFMYDAATRDTGKEYTFLTNSADTTVLVRDFGITPKTTHQLRAAITLEEQEFRNQKHLQKKQAKRNSQADDPPKTLFRYEDESSEEEMEEQVVFQPRTRPAPRPGSSGRGMPGPNYRGRAAHSPSNSISSPPPTPKPQIPVEEIDPDSFDRGSFARGSIPLANVGGPSAWPHGQFGRGGFRGQSSPAAPRGRGFRGGHTPGMMRGRGRLFVP